MGILNVTPDSFSDGGYFLRPSDALKHACFNASEGLKKYPPSLNESGVTFNIPIIEVFLLKFNEDPLTLLELKILSKKNTNF